jgi:hypothetical protein
VLQGDSGTENWSRNISRSDFESAIFLSATTRRAPTFRPLTPFCLAERAQKARMTRAGKTLRRLFQVGFVGHSLARVLGNKRCQTARNFDPPGGQCVAPIRNILAADG